jgi:translation elongation factor EF-Ts
VQGPHCYVRRSKVDRQKDNMLVAVRKLSKESHAGLLFSYKALKRFDFDYQKALAYLKSDAFKTASRM